MITTYINCSSTNLESIPLKRLTIEGNEVQIIGNGRLMSIENDFSGEKPALFVTIKREEGVVYATKYAISITSTKSHLKKILRNLETFLEFLDYDYPELRDYLFEGIDYYYAKLTAHPLKQPA